MIITKDNINNLQQAISNPAEYKNLQLLVDSVCTPSSFGEAYRLLQNLQTAISQTNIVPENKEIVNNLLLKLQYYSLPFLNGAMQQELIRRHLLFALNNNIDVFEIFKNILSVSWFVEDASKRKTLVEFLENNSELLGDADLHVGTATFKPTVSNWIQDYKRQESVKSEFDAYRLITYLNSGANPKLLKPTEKERLREVLMLYNWLRIPGEKIDITELSRFVNQRFRNPVTKPITVARSAPKVAVRPTPEPVILPKSTVDSKPIQAKATPPKPPQARQSVTLKDLGPYVLGAEPQDVQLASRSIEQNQKKGTPKPVVRDTGHAVREPEEPAKVIPSSNYQGFSTDLIKDVEEFSQNVQPISRNAQPVTHNTEQAEKLFKPEVKAANPNVQIPIKPKIPKPKAEEVRPKGPPVGAHELEDVLERARLKADANIPLSASDVQAIIDLIKRKKENK